MAANTREIEITVVDEENQPWEGGVVRVVLLTKRARTAADVVGRENTDYTLDASGQATAVVVVPDDSEATYLYEFELPDGQLYRLNIGQGAATTLHALITAQVAASEGSVNAMDALISAHNTNPAAHDGILEPALGNPGSDGYLLSSTAAGVRSWVAASSGAGDVDELTTTAGSAAQLLRVAAGGGLEYRTPVQTLADIGAAASGHDHAGVYEPTLGNPASDGYILSSTAAGVRSWVVAVGLAVANTWSALQTFTAGIVAAWIAPAADSTSAFQVRKADRSTAVVTVDTSNGELWVGATSSDTKMGVGAGRNKSGSNQTAYGADAGRDATGLNQTAIGRNTGRSNVGGFQTAIGQGAGQDNQGGNQSAFGYDAGRNNTGIAQIAFGQNAGKGNSGSSQTAVGYGAGENNTGGNTTFVGRERGVGNAVDGAIELGNALGALISGVCAAASADSSIDLNGVVTVAEDLIIPAPTVPASAAAAGAAGQIAWDSGYLYICVAANTWKRVAIGTW